MFCMGRTISFLPAFARRVTNRQLQAQKGSEALSLITEV
jgi:hypothetical protein